MKTKSVEFTLSDDVESVDWEALSRLFERVGWKGRTGERLQKAFHASQETLFAYSEGKLIGCCRVVGDGEFYAQIFDVIVDPDYQRLGVGRAMVEALLEKIGGMPWVALSANQGNEELFRKFGFIRQRAAMAIVQDPFSEFMEV